MPEPYTRREVGTTSRFGLGEIDIAGTLVLITFAIHYLYFLCSMDVQRSPAGDLADLTEDPGVHLGPVGGHAYVPVGLACFLDPPRTLKP